MDYIAIFGIKRQCCVTRIYGIRCIRKLRGIYSNTICKTCCSARHGCKDTSCAANTCSLCECTLPLNAVTPFGISSPAVREGTISRPQQDAKFQYASTISTHLITRVNKREVDLYNCPLIGGGEIGLVKEI